jgi:hypothetical protein
MQLRKLKAREQLRGAVRLWMTDEGYEIYVPITVTHSAIDHAIHLKELNRPHSSFADVEDLFFEIGDYVFNTFAKRNGSPVIINHLTLRALPRILEAFLNEVGDCNSGGSCQN